MKDFFPKDKLDRTKGMFLDFTEKYQIFNPEFIEKYPLLKYQKILLSFFTACFFLLMARLFGFSFGFDWPLLLVLFVCLFFILAVWEIRKRRSVVYPEIKKAVLKIEERFVEKRQTVQERMMAQFPKRLTGKMANPITLILATTLIFFGWVWRNIVLVGAVLGTVADLFIFELTSDLMILFLIIFWIFSIKYFKFRGKVSLALSLLFLSAGPFFLIFRKVNLAEKTALWAYMFLVIGTIQMMREDIGVCRTHGEYKF